MAGAFPSAQLARAPAFAGARASCRICGAAHHDTAGQALVGDGERFRRIRQLIWDHTNPPDGCATFSTAMRMLLRFEEDLFKHIHLETNILFPRAMALEQAHTAIPS